MDQGSISYRKFCHDSDEAGLVEIIRDYKDGLILYLNSFTGNIHTAEDLAEDTFVLLGVRKPRDKGIGSFKTWLYTIGRNIAIDHLRRSVKKSIVSLDDCPELTSDEENLATSYIRQERKIQINRAMQSLKPEYRQFYGSFILRVSAIKRQHP